MSDSVRADKGEALTSTEATRQDAADATEASTSKSPSAMRSPSLHRSSSRASHRRSRRRNKDHASTAASPTQRTTSGSSSSQTPHDEAKQKRASKAPSVEEPPPKSGERSVPAEQATPHARGPAEGTAGRQQLDSTAPADLTRISEAASLAPLPPVPPDRAEQESSAVLLQPAPPREPAAIRSEQQDSPGTSPLAQKGVSPSSPALMDALSAASDPSPMVHSFWSMFSSNEYQMSIIGKRGEYLVCMTCGVFTAALILVSFLLAAHLTSQPDYVFVLGPFGAVRGIAITSEGGRRVQAFYGVPFAKEPVGALRFARPQPSEPGVTTAL
ncbi:uncharacterized protein LOC144095290 [Amblyomma americanum]